jgi:hypothetical protein
MTNAAHQIHIHILDFFLNVSIPESFSIRLIRSIFGGGGMKSVMP